MGGGIVGCAAAAFLAEAGARVELFERGALAGAASGRNSGSIQHPFDPVLAELHRETLSHYRELDGFELPPAPAGVLMRGARASRGRARGRGGARAGRAAAEPRGAARARAGLARGLWGCRLETGYPVRPAAATLAFARRAHRGRAPLLHEGRVAWPWVLGGGVRGVLAGGEHCAAGAVLVAAGPWTPEVIDPTRAWQPIVPVWGVVVEVQHGRSAAPRVEQAGVEGLGAGGRRPGLAVQPGRRRAAGRRSGSTFLAAEPDPVAWAGTAQAGAASPSCRRSSGRRSTAPAPAPARSRSTAARWSGRPARSRGSGSPRATGPGASRPARRPAGWPPTRCSGGPSCPPSWRPSASARVG